MSCRKGTSTEGKSSKIASDQHTIVQHMAASRRVLNKGVFGSFLCGSLIPLMLAVARTDLSSLQLTKALTVNQYLVFRSSGSIVILSFSWWIFGLRFSGLTDSTSADRT